MDNPFPTEEIRNDYYSNYENVIIYHNNELGYYVWAVVDYNNQEYWIDSFETKKDALDLCKEFNYKII